MSEISEKLQVAIADRYTIERELGAGGMATVYLAEDLKHKRKVALKVLRPELAAVLGAERFVQEITTTAALQHPHILPLYDSGKAGGREGGTEFLYYVMPYVEGETLRDKLDRETQLGIDEAVKITAEVADALYYAHQQGVIHRDIKPENILLHNGRPMLADFGIALSAGADRNRLTGIGLVIGTPAYMSPEQVAADRNVDAHTDQYALACVVYEMLAGDPPFVASSDQAVMARHVTDAAPPIDTVRPEVNAAVVRALTKALAKAPIDRHESVSAFCAALTSDTSPVDSGPMSIAVLPFVNMSPDPDQEYFADGMAEELISALTKVPGLRVIARMSAFVFKGTNQDIVTIGARLRVAMIVEGSVRRLGGRLRVTVQLIEVSGGHQVWSERYDRALDDLFEVQDDIARRIVTSITPKLIDQGSEALIVRPTNSQDAYDLYLRAGEHLARLSSAETRKAVTMLDSATALDPHFAGAWARLSGACCLMDGWFDHGVHWHDKTDQALTRALELDPDNAEARMVQGRVLWTPRHGFRHREALRALEESLRSQPGSAAARLWHSLILLHVGLMTNAEEGLEELLATEPNDATVLQFIAQCMLFQFRFDAAQEYQARALAADPGHHFAQIFQPTVLLYQNDLAGAESALGVARQLLKDDPLLDGNEALLWAKRGERDHAEAAIARATDDRPSVSHSHHAWHYAAAAYAVLHEHSKAIALLRDSADAGLPNYPLFRDDPHLNALRTDSDMTTLLADLQREWTGYRAEFGHA